jgi:hypothetical protein
LQQEEQALENPTLFTAQGHFSQFSNPEGTNLIEEFDCNLALTRNFLAIDSKNGPQHYEFAYRDLSKIVPGNYVVRYSAGEISFDLKSLGLAYQAFLGTLLTARNDQIATDLLIAEGQPSLAVKGLIQTNQDKSTATIPRQTSGEVRVYKTLLGFFPENQDPICVRFPEIKSSNFENYRATFDVLSTIWNVEGVGKANAVSKKIVVSQLGENLGSLQRTFSANSSELQADTNALIKETYPGISSTNLLKLSRLLLDGIPVKASDLNAIDPNFLKAMEFQMAEGKEELIECLNFLYSIGDRDSAFVGAKKLVTNYFYFMIPFKNGKAVALETHEEGHATYFFSRPESSDGEQVSPAEQFAMALREVNYRRTPIYLSNDDLLKPEYGKYRFSIDLIPALRFLRKHFLGRAIHSDLDSWKSQVTNILSEVSNENQAAGQSTSSTALSERMEVISPVPLTSQAPRQTDLGQEIKGLNLKGTDEQIMVERILSVKNMEGVEEGRVKMYLKDDEMDQDIYVKLSSSEIAQLGAFPGTKVKLSIQKA